MRRPSLVGVLAAAVGSIVRHAFGRVSGAAGGGIQFPPPGNWPGSYVYDAATARRVPAVARALQLYSGMCKQMPMDAYRGPDPIDRPRLLFRPDPWNSRPWFVQVNVEDYLLNGNAIALVTARGYDGWPLAVTWLPAVEVGITWNPPDYASVRYEWLGNALRPADVVHVKRGADRRHPCRGVGVVEEFLSSLDRVAMEEEYERAALLGGAVPSVAIITPQAQLTQDVADEAKEAWRNKFAGPEREPAILPAGSQVVPLAWSPSDTQMIEARKLSLLDVANMFNLDSYWLGAPVSGLTYRTAGPQYQSLLRTSLEPVLADFEDVWSEAFLPRGTTIRFERNQLLRDDLMTTATALSTLVGAGIVSPPEASAYLGLPAAGGGNPTEIQQVTEDAGANVPALQGGPA